MTQPDGRTGVTAHPGTPLPGQPPAGRTTDVVVHPEPSPPPETTSDPAAGAAPAHREAVGTGFLARPHDDLPDDDEPDDDRGPWMGGRTADQPEDDATATRPDYRDAPVVVRRSDDLAALCLLLAGIAAGVSLLVVWVHGGESGLDMVQAGVRDLRVGPRTMVDRDHWYGPAVVAGGAVLFLLGLLLLVPARTHRLLGLLALLVTGVVAAGVLVPLSEANWDYGRFAIGGWFTVAAGVLGLLGALKALLTGPHRRR
jgi:hypothetical protein